MPIPAAYSGFCICFSRSRIARILCLTVIGIAFKLTWGLAKIVASILMVFALPLLVVGIIFWSGIALLVPIALLCGAFGILKACV